MGGPSCIITPQTSVCCVVQVRWLLSRILGLKSCSIFFVPLALQLSFMLEEAPTSGSVNSTAEEKQQLAAQSLDFNVSLAS